MNQIYGELFKGILYLIRHQVFISIGAVFFYQAGCRLYGIPISESWLTSSAIFWSTLLIYLINTRSNLNVFDLRTFIKTVRRLRTNHTFTIAVIVLIIGAHLLFLPWKAIVFLSHLAIISTLYNPPQKSIRDIVPLRGIPFLKLFLIAYVWTSVGVILPAINRETIYGNGEILRLFTASFVYIIAITLPFDIRDLYHDPTENVITFPQLVGVKITKAVSVALLIVFLLLMQSFLATILWILLFIVALMVIILRADTSKPDWYYTGLLDGSIIMYYFMIAISTK